MIISGVGLGGEGGGGGANGFKPLYLAPVLIFKGGKNL